MSGLNLNMPTMARAKEEIEENDYDVALDPSYPIETIKLPSRAEIEEAFGLAKPMKKLRRALGDFGLDAIAQGIESQYEEYVENEVEWAEKVRYWWWATAPYQTTNLRRAITIDDSEFPKSIEVKLDDTILLQFSGSVLRGYRSQTSTEYRRIPSYNYLKDAEKVNVSAAHTPGGQRGHISDFAKVVWDVYAEKARKELFA